MGHTQGPTSSQREFDPDTSHPFRYDHWYVAHNGVLSNSEELKKEYEVDSPVDSAIIPKLISIKELDCTGTVDAIQQACGELRGTFSCWMYNSSLEEAYIVRCGSTLFANDEGEFSSRSTGNMRALEEGKIYCVDYMNKYIHESGEFRTSSPFFIL